MVHRLLPIRTNLHANYIKGATAVLQISSGDTVIVSAPDVSWGLEAPSSVTLPRRKVEPRDPEGNPASDRGPCLVGPIGVRGAQPGDLLEIEIQEVVTSSWGWTYSGAGMASDAWNEAVGIGDAPLTLVKWEIDQRALTARSDSGVEVPLRPFPGTIGLAPAVPEGELFASGWLPSMSGGNIDCRELVSGSTLLVPVAVEGGLLSVGDGHAAQGDGEVSGTGIECMLETLRMRVTLRHGVSIRAPRILTAHDGAGKRRRVTIGIGKTLDRAAAMATREMLDWMSEIDNGHSRATNLAHASAMMSLRVTQTVNTLRGIHATMEHDE